MLAAALMRYVSGGGWCGRPPVHGRHTWRYVSLRRAWSCPNTGFRFSGSYS